MEEEFDSIIGDSPEEYLDKIQKQNDERQKKELEDFMFMAAIDRDHVYQQYPVGDQYQASEEQNQPSLSRVITQKSNTDIEDINQELDEMALILEEYNNKLSEAKKTRDANSSIEVGTLEHLRKYVPPSVLRKEDLNIK